MSSSNHLKMQLIAIASVTVMVSAMHLPDPPVFGKIAHYPSACYLPPDSGICPGTVTDDDAAGNGIDDDTQPSNERLDVRYYFDPTTGECYPFGVQSCGGNENRFPTLADCQDTCKMK